MEESSAVGLTGCGSIFCISALPLSIVGSKFYQNKNENNVFSVSWCIYLFVLLFTYDLVYIGSFAVCLYRHIYMNVHMYTCVLHK